MTEKGQNLEERDLEGQKPNRTFNISQCLNSLFPKFIALASGLFFPIGTTIVKANKIHFIDATFLRCVVQFTIFSLFEIFQCLLHKYKNPGQSAYRLLDNAGQKSENRSKLRYTLILIVVSLYIFNTVLPTISLCSRNFQNLKLRPKNIQGQSSQTVKFRS